MPRERGRPTTVLYLRIPVELKERVDDAAQVLGVSIRSFVEFALRDYLEGFDAYRDKEVVPRLVLGTKEPKVPKEMKEGKEC